MAELGSSHVQMDRTTIAIEPNNALELDCA